MRAFTARRLLGVLLPSLFLAGGCELVLGNGDGTSSATSAGGGTSTSSSLDAVTSTDGSSNVNSASPASGSAASVGGMGGGLPGLPDTFYVDAENGDDSWNDGTSPARAFKTLSPAVVKAQAAIVLPQILVCAGTYTLDDSVKRAINLHGGYDCKTFDAPDGDPVKGKNPTILTYNQTSLGGPVLTIKLMQTNDQSFSIDGFQIRPSKKTVTQGTVGVLVSYAPNLVLQNNWIQGGAGVGTGGTECAGSIGVFVNQTSAQPLTITGNIIDAGTGTVLTGTCDAPVTSAGILVDGGASSGVISHNTILASGGAGMSSAGISVLGTGLTIERNIITGQAPDGTTAQVASLYGIYLGPDAKNTFVLDNLISGASSDRKAGETYGVLVDGKSGPNALYFNTIFSGYAPTASAMRVTNTGPANVEVRSNIFFGDQAQFGLQFTDPSVPTPIADNSFFGVEAAFAIGATGYDPKGFESPTSRDGVQHNHWFSPDCDGLPSIYCTTVPDCATTSTTSFPAACAKDFFVWGSEPDVEKEQLAVTGGWQIRDKAPCYSWLEDDSYSSLGTLLDAQRTDAQIDITGQNSARMESHMSAGAYQGATGVCVE